jgi:DNA-binding HxlR family transcriptional regulator/predicted transcriptional regulator
MEAKNHINAFQGTEKQTSLTELPQKLEENCRSCNPLTPITCVSGCKTWRMKNQLRNLYEKTRNPDFATRLLNVIKNTRRLQLLQAISQEKRSIPSLQQQLRKLGFNHGQQTILKEYVNPLMEVGLVEEAQNLYFSTVFGHKLSELMQSHRDFGDILPPHSECYEEAVLQTLKNGPKTFKEMRETIPAKSVARVLNRLMKASLIQRTKEREYIYFFRTKRDPNSSELSATERRVYENIPPDGIPARKLAEKTKISVRRTYKYLRKLKGKKLVFVRKKPLSYTLAAKGEEITAALVAIQKLTLEALISTAKVVKDEQTIEQLTTENNEKEKTIHLTAVQHVKNA